MNPSRAGMTYQGHPMCKNRITDVLRAVKVTCVLAGTGFTQGQPGTPSAELLPPPATSPDAGGVRRCLIICGLPGDADHRKLFSESLELLYAGLLKHHGFSPENLHVLWGDMPKEKDGTAVRASRAVATRKTISAAAGALREALQPDDTLWVFVLGHAHYDGRYSWLNVEGTDLQQLEFGRLFEGLRCKEQVFFLTT